MNPYAAFAVAVGARIAAGAIRASAARERAEIDAELDAARERQEETTAAEDEESRARGFGGSVEIRDTIINIQPSVTINGEIVVIGTMGVDELTDTLGQISVRAVQGAIESGEIDLSGVGAAA